MSIYVVFCRLQNPCRIPSPWGKRLRIFFGASDCPRQYRGGRCQDASGTHMVGRMLQIFRRCLQLFSTLYHSNMAGPVSPVSELLWISYIISYSFITRRFWRSCSTFWDTMLSSWEKPWPCYVLGTNSFCWSWEGMKEWLKCCPKMPRPWNVVSTVSTSAIEPIKLMASIIPFEVQWKRKCEYYLNWLNNIKYVYTYVYTHVFISRKFGRTGICLTADAKVWNFQRILVYWGLKVIEQPRSKCEPALEQELSIASLATSHTLAKWILKEQQI